MDFPLSTHAEAAMAVVALGLVLTPGPNMIYLVSRSITQGRRAGMLSLLGVALGFLVYLAAVTTGLTAVFTLVPGLYLAVKLAGAGYLLWLACRASCSPWDWSPACSIRRSR
jgi:threonine/homoserine/homoserine lactone efflux protein